MKFFLKCLTLSLWIVLSTSSAVLAQTKTVRVVYLVPSDKVANARFKTGIENAVKNVQAWYYQKVGATFTMSNPVVEVVRSSRPSAWFNDTMSAFWSDNRTFWFNANTITDIKSIYGAAFNQERYIWVVYVDAKGETGAGGNGIATLPMHDIMGVSGLHPVEKGIPRWHGGLAHEIGHAFGLPHANDNDPEALMKFGYTKYPNCHLTSQDLVTLSRSPFFNIRRNSTPSNNTNSTNSTTNTRNSGRHYDLRYVYNGGSFIKVGQSWVETTATKQYFFKEIARTQYFYTIEDASRGFQIKIPLTSGWSYYLSQNEWKKMYQLTRQ